MNSKLQKMTDDQLMAAFEQAFDLADSTANVPVTSWRDQEKALNQSEDWIEQAGQIVDELRSRGWIRVDANWILTGD